MRSASRKRRSSFSTPATTAACTFTRRQTHPRPTIRRSAPEKVTSRKAACANAHRALAGKIKAGATMDTPVVLYDFFSDAARRAGVDVSHTVGPIDGVNILPLLTGATLPARTLYWHFPNYTNQGSKPAGAVREGDWKMVEDDENRERGAIQYCQRSGRKRGSREERIGTPLRHDGKTRRLAEIGRRANGHAQSGFRPRLAQAHLRGHRYQPPRSRPECRGSAGQAHRVARGYGRRRPGPQAPRHA